MTLGQIIVVAIMCLGTAGIIAGYRYLPKDLKKTILAAMVFGFYAIFLTNIFGSPILSLVFFKFIGESNTIRIVMFVIFAIALTVFVFLTSHYVKDEEQRRKIFFRVAITIFIIGYIEFVCEAAIGIYGHEYTFLPGHICRQTGYALPVVYFTKDKYKKWLLPPLLFIGIAGGVVTLSSPGNYMNPISEWMEFDTIIMHLLQIFTPVAIFASGEIRARWIHMATGALWLCCQLVFSFFCNWIVFLEIGEWGPWGYNMSEIPLWMPKWLFFILCMLGMWMLIASMILTNYLLKKHKNKQILQKANSA